MATLLPRGLTLDLPLHWNGSSIGARGRAICHLVQQVICGDGLNSRRGTDAGPCDIFARTAKYKHPTYTWTVGVQHASPARSHWTTAYVGNHGSRLTGIRIINQADPGLRSRQDHKAVQRKSIVSGLSTFTRTSKVTYTDSARPSQARSTMVDWSPGTRILTS